MTRLFFSRPIPAALLPLLLAAALAVPRAAPAQHAGAAAEEDATAEEGPCELALVVRCPTYEPVVPPAGYREAVEAGTRTAAGVPGPDYWRQRLRYRIRARLVPDSARVVGEETILYRNRSPDTLRRLGLHLYQNLFSEGVQRNRTVPVTGGMDLGRVTVQGRRARSVSRRRFVRWRMRGRPDSMADVAALVVDGTVGRLLLPEPLAPGDSAELEIAWSFEVPADAPRMGRIGRELFSVAQWYPQVATYDDVHGHHAGPYLGDGEFYLDYGSFEVDITVPEGWLVSATGTLSNPGEVLREEAARRLAGAVASDTVLAVVDSAAAASGRSTRPGGEDGTLTWRFRTDRPVRDFAFSASPRYVWDAVGAEVGGDRGRSRVDALYDPSVTHWSEAAGYARHALTFFSDYLVPYPYGHMAVAQGPVGGMEYPMITFIGRSRPGEPLYAVIAHELSHEWFPMMAGSPEADYAWMDEGLTTFNEALARADYFGNEDARLGDMRSWLSVARHGIGSRVMEHTDYVEHGVARTTAAYSKPGTLLHALRTVMGAETFDRAYRRYARAWTWGHPLPWDFFRAMEEAADRDLDCFWRPWFFETATLDQALAGVRPVEEGVEVTVANRGGAVMPVLLEVGTADGETRRVRWPVDVWSGTRRVTRTVEVDGEPVRVQIDPDRRFPDIDRDNGRWEAEGGTED